MPRETEERSEQETLRKDAIGGDKRKKISKVAGAKKKRMSGGNDLIAENTVRKQCMRSAS